MPISDLDRVRLREALGLARGSFGLTEPNPRVGCMLGSEDGQVLGRGATQTAGSAHAEVMALRDAKEHGIDIAGATAWVTLEPCAHQGRTPPCCDALIDAGIGRCVIALRDPNPSVAGRGIARMRAAGLTVELLQEDDEIAGDAREVNVGFLSRMERGRPWVRVKIAASADGRMALENGRSKWITGEAARADGHTWRRRASAVLTGIGTVLADDPRLDVRAVPTVLQPLRIVVDTRLRLPATAAILRPPGNVLVLASAGTTEASARLRDAGAEVWDDWPDGRLPDLAPVLERLAVQKGVNELHVEGGPTLNGALATADMVDEWLMYTAPMIIGPGLPIARLPALDALEATTRYRWLEAKMIGSDLRVRMVRN